MHGSGYTPTFHFHRKMAVTYGGGGTFNGGGGTFDFREESQFLLYTFNSLIHENKSNGDFRERKDSLTLRYLTTFLEAASEPGFSS